MLFLFFLGSFIAFRILLAQYLVECRDEQPKETDKIYTFLGKFSFDNLRDWLHRLEKRDKKKYYGLSNLIDDYEENAERTGRDISYYEDYLLPRLKYLALDGVNPARSWRMINPMLRAIVIFIFLWFFAGFSLMAFDVFVSINRIWLLKLAVALFIMSISWALTAVALKFLLYYLKSKEEKFRKKDEGVLAINRDILGVEGIYAFLGRTKRVGGDFDYGGESTGDGSGELGALMGASVSSGSSVSGGDFGGFGGGSFGGGGSSGTW